MPVGRRTDRFEVSRPEVVGSVVDGEVVAINLDTGSYYNISGSGADVWVAVERTASAQEVTARVAHCFGVPVDDISDSVIDFMEQLLSEGLIRPADPGATGAEPSAGDPRSDGGAAFSPPVLEKFTDMEDLLLVDPVHDVTDRGWPHVEAD
jgi:Coenzyme PQQ synthesis protein D (PqqD)